MKKPLYLFSEFGVLILLGGINIVLTTFLAYRNYGVLGMLGVLVLYGVIVLVGGIVINKKRKVSLFGPLIREKVLKK